MCRVFLVRLFVVCTLCGAAAIDVSAQSSPVHERAAELGRAWTALSRNDYKSAGDIAEQLLKRAPMDHAALLVAITARSAAGQPLPALDVYEQWLRRAKHEDIFLLEPIALGTLVTAALGPDPGLAAMSLAVLTERAPDVARLVLERRAPDDPLDGVRAALGDAAAAARLVDMLASPVGRQRAVALYQLKGVRGIAASPITKLLADPAPPTRAAAIELLAANEGAAAIGTLRPLLKDPDPFVRATAAVELGRLRDADAMAVIAVMAKSATPDTAAMAGAVLKEQGADVSAIVERVLAAENPLVRLSAVTLMTDADRARAEALLAQAAQDANPVVRSRAAEMLADSPVDNPALLRVMLRDASAEVRIRAAVAILRLAA